MHFPTLAKFVTIVLPLHALAQGPTSTFPGLGILQQMTPTVDANKVPITAVRPDLAPIFIDHVI